MLDRFTNLKCAEHYLRRISNSYDIYMQGLCEVLEKLGERITPKQLDEIIENKLQVGLHNFNESQFIQSACELTVMNEFITRQDIVFHYENKITPPKDVDFSINIDRVNYNVEVKCPSYKNKHQAPKNEIELTFTNRAPTKDIKSEIVNDIGCRLSQHNLTITEGKNLDNKLKDFLLSTQEKVEKSDINDINVLVVCCNDAIDMHTWREYLFGFSGFFTEHSFIPHKEFERVDYVLLTNIYNRHYRFFDDYLVTNHWCLSKSFNLLYPNKYSKRNQNVDGEKDLKMVNSVFNNHNINFEEYLKDEQDVPIGENQLSKETRMGVAWYSDKYKGHGIHYFSGRK